MSNKAEKQYGLIIPKKQQPVTPKATNIFADDNGSDEEDGTDWVRKALKAEGEKNKMKKQTKLSMQKALKEDPTIYQYDEVYDDMERTKTQVKVVSEEKKRPKYIENLLKAAERRKKEQEHRIERMVQKEREAEGSMYADKESFVTSAYRAKLEEFKKMEEEESRMDRLEAIGDVTKQQDMSGFYRHLYEQTIDNSKQTEDAGSLKESHINITDENTNSSCNVTDGGDRVNSSKETDTAVVNSEEIINIKTKKNRQYRQRVVEEDESDTEPETKQEVESKSKISLPKKNKNTDNTGTDEIEAKRKKQEIKPVEPDTTEDKVETEHIPQLKHIENTDNTENNIKTDKEMEIKKQKIAAEKREKSKIWEKRTVGPIFEAALERYYARKAMRLVGS